MHQFDELCDPQIRLQHPVLELHLVGLHLEGREVEHEPELVARVVVDVEADADVRVEGEVLGHGERVHGVRVKEGVAAAEELAAGLADVPLRVLCGQWKCWAWKKI